MSPEAENIMTILRENPTGITADGLCAELRKRGLAFDDLSPARLGLEPDDILRIADFEPVELLPLTDEDKAAIRSAVQNLQAKSRGR